MKRTISAVGEFKIIEVLTIVEGRNVRKSIAPINTRGEPTNISTEPQEIQDACNEAWTTDVVQAYREHLESVV